MQRFVAALVCALVLATVGDARAAMMLHHDLRSLFMMSDAVVKVERTGERWLNQWQRVTSFRVIASYEGPLHAGVGFDVAGPSAYNFGDLTQPSAQASTPKEMVLFLRRAEQSQQQSLQAQWLIVPSGIRFESGGKVQRFEQWSNPGPYVPVAQGHDPDDLLGLPGGAQPLNMKQFERELTRAKQRAQEAAGAIETGSVARLLAALGPPHAERVHAADPGSMGFFADEASRRVIARLDALGDVPAMLEGVSRVEAGLSWYAMGELKSGDAELLAFASDANRPLYLRLAAIRVLRGKWRRGRHLDPTALGLLEDASAEVREAAVPMLSEAVDEKAVKPAIERRWMLEDDPNTQYRLLVAAQRHDIVNRLARGTRPRVPVLVKRNHDVLVIEYAWFDQDAWRLTSARVLIRDDELERGVELMDGKGAGGWSSMGRAGARVRIELEPPLEPGHYEVVVKPRLEQMSGPNHLELSRALGSWEISVPKSSPTPAHDVAQPAGDPTPLDVVVPVVPPARRGCACSATRTDKGEPHWLLAAVAMLLLFTRRAFGAMPRRC